MSRRLAVSIGLALAALPSPALAQSGGAASPVAGGYAYEQPDTPSPARAGRLRVTGFTISPASVALGDHVEITWRIDGPASRVRARVDLLPVGGGQAASINLGTRLTGRRITRRWTPRTGRVAAGRYVARLYASAGRLRLRRTARASDRLQFEITAPPPPSAPVGRGVFPVQGPYGLGGPEARFGAPRAGHSHQGQDILAAEGTPVVTPVAGVVHWVGYQATGAGHYVIVSGADGRDYAFMHLQDGSVVVEKDQRLAAGQRLGSVGATGDAAGPHLHFEIWPGGWYSSPDSHPIDPMPDLVAWG
jgi:murein DD-endopeptidase MepM/ murein hydrolase activator NlpD